METAIRRATRIGASADTDACRGHACTVLSGTLAVVLCVGIGVVWMPAGVVAFVAFTGIIAKRGYLVPGTPAVIRRLSTAIGIGVRHPDGESTVTAVADGGTLTDTEWLLRSMAVLEPSKKGATFELADRFRDVWWRRIRRFQDEERAITQLASVIEVDPDALAYEDAGGQLAIVCDGGAVGGWISEAALIADLAVESTLREWIPGWDELGDDRRTTLIASLRTFLEACPRCEASLETKEDVRLRCVSKQIDSETVHCDSCGDLVFGGSRVRKDR